MEKDFLTIAVDEHGTPITMSAYKATRGVIQGVSGSGKTQGLMVLLAELAQCEDISVVIVDPKKVGFFPCLERFDVVVDEEDFTPVLRAYYSEMMRRYSHMREKRVSRLPVDDEFPLLWLVIDEIAEFLSGEKKVVEERTSLLTKIASLSRQANMSLIVAGQQLDTTVIPSKLRSNLVDTQMVFRTANATHTKLIVADGCAENAPAHLIPTDNPGEGYFLTDRTAGGYAHGKCFYITDDALSDVCSEFARFYRPAGFLG